MCGRQRSTTVGFCAMFDDLVSANRGVIPERVRPLMKFSRKTAALCAAAGLALLATACGNNSNSPTTPTRTPAAPTVSERYVSTMGVGGSSVLFVLGGPVRHGQRDAHRRQRVRRSVGGHRARPRRSQRVWLHAVDDGDGISGIDSANHQRVRDRRVLSSRVRRRQS